MENVFLLLLGASSYHNAIDIAAPEKANILAIENGVVKFTNFLGASGYTVVIEHDENLLSYYSHVSPQFLVSLGQSVKKGQIIANVGPKIVYGVPNNPYKDASGKPTNRSYYRGSSSFCN